MGTSDYPFILQGVLHNSSGRLSQLVASDGVLTLCCHGGASSCWDHPVDANLHLNSSAQLAEYPVGEPKVSLPRDHAAYEGCENHGDSKCKPEQSK